jgi:hypothetical protein
MSFVHSTILNCYVYIFAGIFLHLYRQFQKQNLNLLFSAFKDEILSPQPFQLQKNGTLLLN